MVPADYRLDTVTARLIERLEGARPTYGGDPDRALAAFEETARGHVEAAIAEYADLAREQAPEPHAAFLRKEVLATALPRYVRLAVAFTRAEERGFGFGPLAEPLGRLGLGVLALLLLWLVLIRLVASPVAWPLVLVDLSMPLWPTAAAWLSRRRYHGQLEALVADMARIQDSERAYLSSAELGAARQLEAPARRPTPQGERS